MLPFYPEETNTLAIFTPTEYPILAAMAHGTAKEQLVLDVAEAAGASEARMSVLVMGMRDGSLNVSYSDKKWQVQVAPFVLPSVPLKSWIVGVR